MKVAVLEHFDSMALVPILGRSAFQRHLHHLGRIGIVQVWVRTTPQAEGDGAPADGAALESDCRKQGIELGGEIPTLHFGTPDPDPLEETVFVHAAAVFDPRLYQVLADADGPLRLVDESGDVGLSRSSGPDATMAVLRVSEIPAYLPAMRRHLRPAWQHLRGEGDLRAAADHLMAATQKGILDFPARYLHPIPENALTRMFSRTKITPNQITVATGFMGFGATYLFATGRIGAAILIAIAVNVLDGVDGKLARVKLLTSRFGDRLDHTLDVSFEFSWYLAIGWGLWQQTGERLAFEMAFGLIAVMLGCRTVSGIYRTLSGQQIHDHTAFDRAVRLVAGRRNIYVMIYLAGWLTGEFAASFGLTLGWALATLGIYIVRAAMAATTRILTETR